jgi:hypothetical protein
VPRYFSLRATRYVKHRIGIVVASIKGKLA